MERDRAHRTDLHYAALEGRVSGLHAALAAGEDPSDPDGAGFTPLHFSAQQQRVEATEVLLAAGADVHARNRSGATPLHLGLFSARDLEETVVPLLLAAGRIPTYPTPQG